jgi:nucleotide-binding universal stress UspA family protein
MAYASIMVFIEADAYPEPRVRLAANLAKQFNAMLIGLSATGMPPPVVAGGMVLDQPTEWDVKLSRAKLDERGNWFRGIAGDDQRQLEWRSVVEIPIEALTREARNADLVIIGQVKMPGSAYATLNPGAAILKLGRPALIVPEAMGALRGEHVVIGWKDTREARRAVRDALPFLQRATRVSIVEACGSGEEEGALARLEDLTRYLARHQVKSGPRIMLEQKGSGAQQLLRVAQNEHADLLVAGAYGHSRLGEWMFGGMTRELLAASPICCLMSH